MKHIILLIGKWILVATLVWIGFWMGNHALPLITLYLCALGAAILDGSTRVWAYDGIASIIDALQNKR